MRPSCKDTGSGSDVRRPEPFPSQAPVIEFVRRANKPPDWVVEGTLLANSLVIVAGEPKLGMKTVTMMRLALSVARGEPFLGRKVKCKRTVIFSFLEDGPIRAGWRAKAMGITEDEDLSKFIFTIGEEGLLGVIDKVRRATEPMVWIIDSMIELEAIEGIQNENDPIAIAKLLKKFRAAIQESGSTLIIVHHFRKDGDKMRGSTALNGAVDGWINSFTKGQNRVQLEFTDRDAVMKPIGLEMLVTGTEESPKFSFVEREVEETRRGRGRPKGPSAETIKTVTGIVQNGPAQRLWTAESVRKAGVELGAKTIEGALKKLVTDGLMVASDGGWRIASNGDGGVV